MDDFDPFAGFATELKGSLPKQNGGANNAAAPIPGDGDINTSKAGFSGNMKSPTSTLQSKSMMPSSSSSMQQPMMNKGTMMPVMGGGGGGYVQQQQPPPRNAPMPSSSFAPTFQPQQQQQQQQKPPPMMMQQQQPWGGGNNNWQQQPQKTMQFQQQQMMQPPQMQYPAPIQFQQQQQQMFQQQQQQQQFQQPFGMQPTPNAPVTMKQNPVMQNQQPQQYPMQQKQMQQSPAIQQKSFAAATPQQQQQKPAVVAAAQQQPKPVVPKQQSQDEYEYDAVFARIPSIVHTKSVASSNDGADDTLPHSNSDGEISQLNDDNTMTSFCPPPPSVAPPPPPPAAEQAAFQNALLAPSPSSPSTNLADYDMFGGLFDSAQFPVAAATTPTTPPSTPYDFNHMKSMDSGPDGYLASNPSIDDDYLFSEDEDDDLGVDDDPFGVFGAKPATQAPMNKEKASDVSSTLGIATKKPTKGEEEPSSKTSSEKQHDSQHEKHKLPPGGEFFDCKVYTSTVGVMFFSPFELTDSLYLNMDRETVINVLGQRPVVAHMLEESAAQSVGVQLGYVLLQVNGRDVKTPLEANLAIRESSRPMNLLFYILKDPIMVAEGQYMVKYNTRDTGAPPTSRDWKPKYCVVGGIIAHSHMLNMYRSKAEYDRAVMDTQSRRPVSVKVKQFSLIGARMWNEVGKENGISKPHIRKVKYRSQMKPWNYITVLPLKKDPIKISIPGSSTDKDNGLQQLKLVHEGIRRVIHGQNNANNKNHQDAANASSEQP